MEFEVKTTVYIDIDYIIENYKLNSNSLKAVIKDAINDYVDSMDDCDYYLIDDNNVRQRIFNEISNRIGLQLSLFDD